MIVLSVIVSPVTNVRECSVIRCVFCEAGRQSLSLRSEKRCVNGSQPVLVMVS